MRSQFDRPVIGREPPGAPESQLCAVEVVAVGQLARLEGEGNVAEIRSAISMHATRVKGFAASNLS
jgi:hypothetical protein